MEKYSESELWDIANGITIVLQSRPLKSNDNVSLFWYDLYKSIEHEIDKRLLAND